MTGSRKSLVAGLAAMLAMSGMAFSAHAEDTIKVGILHSLSGTMAISETTLKDAMLMLIEQQNAKGGLLGKKLEAVVVDPASDWPLFAEKARELIEKDQVAAVFGCWTSVSRKSVLPVFKELNSILFYPVQYEGEESERNVFYTGAAPNQQAIPAVDYLMNEEGVERWVLAGTDYVYPRTTNKILEAYLKSKGVAEEDIMINYTPFGHSDWQTIVSDIKAFGSAGKKTAVVSTINGDAGHEFHPVGGQDDQEEAHEVGKEIPDLRPGNALGKVVGDLQDHLKQVVEARGDFIGRSRAGAQAERQQEDEEPRDECGDERIRNARAVKERLRPKAFCARKDFAGQLDGRQHRLGKGDDAAENDHQDDDGKNQIAFLESHDAVLSLSSLFNCSTVRFARARMSRLIRTMAKRVSGKLASIKMTVKIRRSLPRKSSRYQPAAKATPMITRATIPVTQPTWPTVLARAAACLRFGSWDISRLFRFV